MLCVRTDFCTASYIQHNNDFYVYIFWLKTLFRLAVCGRGLVWQPTLFMVTPRHNNLVEFVVETTIAFIRTVLGVNH